MSNLHDAGEVVFEKPTWYNGMYIWNGFSFRPATWAETGEYYTWLSDNTDPVSRHRWQLLKWAYPHHSRYERPRDLETRNKAEVSPPPDQPGPSPYIGSAPTHGPASALGVGAKAQRAPALDNPFDPKDWELTNDLRSQVPRPESRSSSQDISGYLGCLVQLSSASLLERVPKDSVDFMSSSDLDEEGKPKSVLMFFHGKAFKAGLPQPDRVSDYYGDKMFQYHLKVSLPDGPVKEQIVRVIVPRKTEKVGSRRFPRVEDSPSLDTSTPWKKEVPAHPLQLEPLSATAAIPGMRDAIVDEVSFREASDHRGIALWLRLAEGAAGPSPAWFDTPLERRDRVREDLESLTRSH